MAAALLIAVAVQFLLSPAACSSAPYYCDWCHRSSTASFLPPEADATAAAAGVCGYGSTAAELADGGYHIAAATAEFFRDGDGCGACYQLRCRDRRVCGDDGVKVVVTNVAETTNRTGRGRFLLGKDAFTAMLANNAMTALDHSPTSGTAVEVDFRRIPCEYKKNLAVRVEETSGRDRGRLAIRFLYQGGQTDIAAVQIAQAGASASPSTWRDMTRRKGGPLAAVWCTSRVPPGPLQLRLVVTAGSGGKWLRTGREAVLPAAWRPGEVYDTGLRVNDVAVRTCGGSCAAASEAQEDEELR